MKKIMMIYLIGLMAVGTVQANYDVNYTAELKGDSCIKFEDAMYEVEADVYESACLGEDGVVETDTFVVTVDGVVEEIEVTVKAGRGKDSQENGTIVPGVTDSVVILGFTIELFEVADGTYTFKVTSDDDNTTAALSYVMFCFDDATVTAPEEGPYTVVRESVYDEPTEPEEEDGD